MIVPEDINPKRDRTLARAEAKHGANRRMVAEHAHAREAEQQHRRAHLPRAHNLSRESIRGIVREELTEIDPAKMSAETIVDRLAPETPQ